MNIWFELFSVSIQNNEFVKGVFMHLLKIEDSECIPKSLFGFEITNCRVSIEILYKELIIWERQWD